MDRVAHQGSINSSRAKAAIRTGRAANQAQLHPTSRLCSNARSTQKVTLRQGEREKIITKAAAGIEQLVNQFAKGDRHARRDLLALAERLGVDLMAGRGDALEQSVAAALSANDEALLADYVRRHAVPANRPGEIDAGSRPG